MFSKWFKNDKVNPAVNRLMRVAPFETVSDSTVVNDSVANIWESVSISRSQFDELYVGTIRNIAFYMQDKKLFNQTLSQAATELQSTLITKLPYQRPREEAAKYEQLWKYTLVCCHLFKGAAGLNRRFYNRNGARILYPGFQSEDVYFDSGPCERAVLLSQSLQAIIPKTASVWLLQDDERCLREINNAVFGLPCFIDKAARQEDSIINASSAKPESEKQIVSDTSRMQLLEVISEKNKSVSDVTKPTAVELNENSDLPALPSFLTWIESQKLAERDGQSYFKSRETVEAFLRTQKTDCTVGQYQDKLIENGFILDTIRGRKNKKIMVMFMPENSNV